jgi:LysR family transcriptional regulator, glycine cleavage system transcriptional activator
LVPAASPCVAAQIGVAATAETLASWPWIHDSDTSQWRTWLGEAGIRYYPRPRDRRFEDYDLVLAAAAASLGLALIRKPLADDWLNGRLVAVSDRAAVNPMAHYVAWRRDDTRKVVAKLVGILSGLPTGCTTANGFSRG